MEFHQGTENHISYLKGFPDTTCDSDTADTYSMLFTVISPGRADFIDIIVFYFIRFVDLHKNNKAIE